MSQQLQPWRSGRGQVLWLSMLVDTMEKLSSPEWREVPCDDREVAELRAHLSWPAAAYLAWASRFSLRN